ncbi:polysaccharide biosynthesis tyrosine autokinase [Homoserinimonas sp. OAct 916]|uniref:polysaccharide biosynthesis tyrosine autokinase n=1 Tax=Homoserinimonas sp. OAct 916 TaxID=2211450 RepID=UPI000DBDFFB6|nr:polysaccharide biosynthesis tyrosine autokinase [Homoserinimonas sp. OAct 916]
MEQRQFWALLHRRWMTVVAFGLLGVLIGSAYVLTATPEYTADAELFVSAVGADNTSDLVQGSNFSQQQARNYAVVATREIVLDPVIEALGLETTSKALARRVSASVPLNTSLISISVTDTSPARAAATANAIATSLTNTIPDLVSKRSDGSSPVRLGTIQTATPPTIPTAPKPRMVIALALILGLAFGVGFIVVREMVGAKVRTPDQIKQLMGLTVLGSVAFDRATPNRPLISHSSGPSVRAEEFREIRTNLRFLHAGQSHKVFVVTSSIPGEGKSTTSANLAAALAATGTSVCLVEADLRKPSLGTYLDLEGGIGLTTVLAKDASLDDCLQPWGPDNLRVLLSGQIPPNPSELLGSPQLKKLFNTLRNRFDVLIIDCPPLIPVTDAAIVASIFGGAILVVGCGKVELRELRRSVDALSVSGSPVLGVIANMAPVTMKGRYQRIYAQADEGRRGPKRPSKKSLAKEGATR